MASSSFERASRACSRLLSRISCQLQQARRRSGRCGCAPIPALPCWLCSWPASSDTLRCAMYSARCASSRCCSAASSWSRKLVSSWSSSASRFCSASISHAQRLDLALAQQRALLGRAGAQHAHPAGAHAFAGAGDDRIAVAQLRLQAARFGQGLGDMQARQQATDRQRALHFCRQRSGGELKRRRRRRRPARCRPSPSSPSASTSVSGASTSTPSISWPSAPSTAFSQPDSTVSFSPTRAAESSPRDFSQATAAPCSWPSAACCRVSSEDRRPRAAWALLADFGQLRLRATLLFLQCADGLLAGFQIGVEAVQRGLLGFVLLLHLLEHQRQRVQVQAAALAGQRLRGGVGFQRLPVQVIDAGALDFAGARGFGRFARCALPSAAASRPASLRRRAGLPACTGRRPAAAPAAARPRRRERAARPAASRRR